MNVFAPHELPPELTLPRLNRKITMTPLTVLTGQKQGNGHTAECREWCNVRT